MGKQNVGKRITVDRKNPGSTLNEFKKENHGYTDNTQSHIENGKLPIVEIPNDITQRKTARLLVDTGSEVSLIKRNVLKQSTKIDKQRAVSINTPFGSGRTLGQCRGKFYIPTEPTCEFQVVEDELPIPDDGILGYNFIGPHCNVEGPNKVLKFPSKTAQDFTTPLLKYKTEEYQLPTAKNSFGNLCNTYIPNKESTALSKAKFCEENGTLLEEIHDDSQVGTCTPSERKKMIPNSTEYPSISGK